jgi:hypothetical protein
MMPRSLDKPEMTPGRGADSEQAGAEARTPRAFLPCSEELATKLKKRAESGRPSLLHPLSLPRMMRGGRSTRPLGRN